MQKFYFSILILSILTGCTMEKSTNKPISGIDALWIEDNERNHFEKMVLAGDATHATKLVFYYTSYWPQKIDAGKWTLLGAKLKEENSIHDFNLLKEEYIIAKTRKISMPKNAFFLSAEEIETKKKEADKGNGSSAFWLFMYYKFSANDQKEAEKWRLIAEKAGIVLAKQSYWNDPLDGPDRWQGLIWIEKTTEPGITQIKIMPLTNIIK